MKIAKVGLLIEQNEAERRWKLGINVFEVYMEQVLLQAGIPFQLIADSSSIHHEQYDIVIVALIREEAVTAQRLWDYAEQGGILVALANLNAFAPRLGYSLVQAPDSGYARFGANFVKAEAVRFLASAPWRAYSTGHVPSKPDSEAKLQRELGLLHAEHPQGAQLGAALQTFQIGNGLLARWAVHIAGTVVGMQQGKGPVLEDGAPAPDGMASIDDGLLKAEDGCTMSWEFDRVTTETGVPYFPHPYADYWRELLVGQLLHIVLERSLTLPLVGYWPEGVAQVGLISHDSDLNGDINAQATLDVLAECGIRSTWCMIEEGYSGEMYERILSAGHELALHYNALEVDNGRWAEEEFARQWNWFVGATGLPKTVSNKNHYTRFEGWGELFEWCEKYGIESDQTRGPSKKSNVGLLYGTCHPYFPIAWSTERNRIYDVVEISFLTQDLDLSMYWPDSSVIVPFLEQVRSVEGVAHFLVHQIHIGNHERVRKSMRRTVEEARARGFEFWTGKMINDWQRDRRRLVEGLFEGLDLSNASETNPLVNELKLDMSSMRMKPVVWIPVGQNDRTESGEALAKRFGVACRQAKLNSLKKL